MNISYLCKQRIVKRDWGSKIQKIFVLVTIGIANAMADTGKIGKIPLLGSRNEGFAESI